MRVRRERQRHGETRERDSGDRAQSGRVTGERKASAAEDTRERTWQWLVLLARARATDGWRGHNSLETRLPQCMRTDSSMGLCRVLGNRGRSLLLPPRMLLLLPLPHFRLARAAVGIGCFPVDLRRRRRPASSCGGAGQLGGGWAVCAGWHGARHLSAGRPLDEAEPAPACSEVSGETARPESTPCT